MQARERDEAGARARLGAALSIFQRLGAQADVARVEQTLTALPADGGRRALPLSL